MTSLSKNNRLISILTVICIFPSLLACTEQSEPANNVAATASMVPQDKITQLQREAQEGDPDAQYNLAYLYENGIGLPKDESKALELYQKAADQGHSDAENSLDALKASKVKP